MQMINQKTGQNYPYNLYSQIPNCRDFEMIRLLYLGIGVI
jgi:hypothetical protein